MKFGIRSALAALGVLAAVTMVSAAETNLNLGMALEPPHLDPTAGAAAAIDEVVYANVFEGLTRVDRNGVVQPALAESWQISDDGLIYTFKLRDGVTFHDGSGDLADQVVFSIERAIAKDSTNAKKSQFEMIAGAAKVDASTVQVTLKRPTGHFLFNMGLGNAVIVSKASADGNKATPVGTGPLKFKRWVKGDRVELEENADYWGDPIALKTTTFKFISDPAAAAAALLAGDVDAFANFPAPEAVAQFEADPRFKVSIGTTEGETILSTNNGKPPFDDVRVRRAIAHALDRQAIIDGAMFGQGTVIGSHFAPHHPAYVDLTGLYPRDLDKARALLAEAGHPDGFKATLKLPPPTYARRGGEIVAAQLAEIGIDLEIIPMEWAQWLEQVFRGKDYDLSIVSHTEARDIGIYARDDYYFDYHSDALKAVIKELEAAADPAEQNRLFGEAQRIVAKDAVNGFLFELAKTGVWNASIEGLWENSPIQANDLTEVRWTN